MLRWGILAAVLLSGCAQPFVPIDEALPEPGDIEPTSSAVDFDAPDINLYWQQDSHPHLLMGREAWIDGQYASISAHEEGIEGGDFGIVIEIRGPKVGHLQYDAELAAAGTFRFDYSEAVFWAGEPICRILQVSAFSSLEITNWAPATGATSGNYDWSFTGDCPDDERFEERARSIRGQW